MYSNHATLSYKKKVTAALELQSYALEKGLWSTVVHIGVEKDSSNVYIIIYPYDTLVSKENQLVFLTEMGDIEKARAFIDDYANKKIETVEVTLRVKYQTDGRLSSEEAMYTAADLVINRAPVSVVDGVKVTDVETAEYSLKF